MGGSLGNIVHRGPNLKCNVWVGNMMCAGRGCIGECSGVNKCGRRGTGHSKLLSGHSIWPAQDTIQSYPVPRPCPLQGLHLCLPCGEVKCFHSPRLVISMVAKTLNPKKRLDEQDWSILLGVCRGNNDQFERLQLLKWKESLMKEQALSRIERMESVGSPQTQGPEMFQIETTGASISTQYSISLLHQYCGRLPPDKYLVCLTWLGPQYNTFVLQFFHNLFYCAPPPAPWYSISNFFLRSNNDLG